MSQPNLDQSNSHDLSSQPVDPAPPPIGFRSADLQVCRVGIRADTSSPEAARPQCPQPQLSVTTPTAAVDNWRGPSPIPRTQRGGPPPSPAPVQLNPERRGGSTAEPRLRPQNRAGKSISSRNATTHGLRAKENRERRHPASATIRTLRQQYHRRLQTGWSHREHSPRHGHFRRLAALQSPRHGTLHRPRPRHCQVRLVAARN